MHYSCTSMQIEVGCCNQAYCEIKCTKWSTFHVISSAVLLLLRYGLLVYRVFLPDLKQVASFRCYLGLRSLILLSTCTNTYLPISNDQNDVFRINSIVAHIHTRDDIGLILVSHRSFSTFMPITFRLHWERQSKEWVTQSDPWPI